MDGYLKERYPVLILDSNNKQANVLACKNDLFNLVRVKFCS